MPLIQRLLIHQYKDMSRTNQFIRCWFVAHLLRETMARRSQLMTLTAMPGYFRSGRWLTSLQSRTPARFYACQFHCSDDDDGYEEATAMDL